MKVLKEIRDSVKEEGKGEGGEEQVPFLHHLFPAHLLSLPPPSTEAKRKEEKESVFDSTKKEEGGQVPFLRHLFPSHLLAPSLSRPLEDERSASWHMREEEENEKEPTSFSGKMKEQEEGLCFTTSSTCCLEEFRRKVRRWMEEEIAQIEEEVGR